jgi:hypothetical protein
MPAITVTVYVSDEQLAWLKRYAQDTKLGNEPPAVEHVLSAFVLTRLGERMEEVKRHEEKKGRTK